LEKISRENLEKDEIIEKLKKEIGDKSEVIVKQMQQIYMDTITVDSLNISSLTVDNVNLIVSGKLSLSQSLLPLKGDFETNDSFDIGFYAPYIDQGITKYTGFFRDSVDKKYHLFDELTEDIVFPCITVPSGISYSRLVSEGLEIKGNLDDGAFQIANSQNANILVSNNLGEIKFSRGDDDTILIRDDTAPLGITWGQFDDNINIRDFRFEKNDVTASTIDNALYTTFLNLSVPFTDTGTYRIGLNFRWSYEPNNRKIDARLRLDNTVDIITIKDNPATGTGEIVISYGLAIETITSGTHDFTFEFRTEKFGDNATVFSAIIEFLQVIPV